MKVLVVDDDPATLRMCLVVLRGEGHECVACDSGAPALQAALRERFDLALCDLGLPDIHGIEVVRAIKLQNPGLPVIVMSALHPSREWADAALQAGASHFLSKPLRIETLRHEVALVQSGRADLDVVVADGDVLQGRRLVLALQTAGCRVQELGNGRAVASLINGGQRPDIVIVDGGFADVGPAIEACVEHGVACFVAASDSKNDDPLLRAGAAMVIGRPVDVDAVLLQARFLVAR